MRTHGSIGRWWSLLIALSMAAAGCGGAAPADPTEALVDAVDRTLSSSFAFDVQVEMDDTAASELSGGAFPVSAVLDSLEIAGRTSGDEVELTVAAMGQQLFEVRQTDATHLYLRTDAGQIAESFGLPFDREQLLADVGQAPAAVEGMWTGLLDGRWVAIVGDAADPADDMMMDEVDPSELRSAQSEAFGDSPEEFIRRFALATPADGEDQDGRTLAVAFQTRAIAGRLLDAMAAVLDEDAVSHLEGTRSELERIPETVGGVTVGVSERVVERITIDLFEVARPFGADGVGAGPEGSLRVVAELSQHGSAGAVEPPGEALEIAAEDLGMYDPRGMLPGVGFGLGMVWPLMGLGSVGTSTSSLEARVEVATPSEVPVPGVELSEAPPPPVGATPHVAGPMSLMSRPSSGPPGTEVTITVAGFEPGPVEIRWDGADGPVLATAEGPDFTVRVNVPAAAPAGEHHIVIEPVSPDARRTASVSFEVTG